MGRTFSGSEDECMNLEKDLQHFGPLCTQPLCAPKVMSTRGKFESQVFHGALIEPLHLSFAWRGGFRFLPDPIDDRR